LIRRLEATAKLIAYPINRRNAGFTNQQKSQAMRIDAIGLLLKAGYSGSDEPCLCLSESTWTAIIRDAVCARNRARNRDRSTAELEASSASQVPGCCEHQSSSRGADGRAAGIGQQR
jgi:hypothetical protein